MREKHTSGHSTVDIIRQLPPGLGRSARKPGAWNRRYAGVEAAKGGRTPLRNRRRQAPAIVCFDAYAGIDRETPVVSTIAISEALSGEPLLLLAGFGFGPLPRAPLDAAGGGVDCRRR